MNELLLALKSSYSSLTAGSTSSRGSSRTSSERNYYDAEMASFLNITPPDTQQDQQLMLTPARARADSPYLDPITPLKVEVDGPTEQLSDISPLTSSSTSEHDVEPNVDPDNPGVDSDNPGVDSDHPDTLFTPRTRKKWSQCTNNLFISYHEDSSSDPEAKETSIDGIFIEFDNEDGPKVVDKTRCTHISALARVTCLHHNHKTPKFAKRRSKIDSTCRLKSKSCEKFGENKVKIKKPSRPLSAGSPLKKKRPSDNTAPPGPFVYDKEQQHIDPLSLLLNTRPYKPSRESLSGSSCDGGSDPEGSGDVSDSDKENEDLHARGRKVSVDEHFLEEGRYHRVKEEADLNSDIGRVRECPVPEDLYKAVQQRTPNDHIFVQYGKEVKRVVVPQLPLQLDKLLEKVVAAFEDSLTPDMVQLKALYIQDAQSKIFYQLDDYRDVIKGSHIKVNEEFVIKGIDRGSSQSLEDLNNSSNSSLSSGGFVIPATVSVPVRPANRRPGGRSRLSLVEEKLSLITSEVINNIHKSETGSTVSSQTEFPGAITANDPSSPKHLHAIIRTLYKNLQDTKSELMILKRREMESRAEMVEVIKTTTEEINRHIEAVLPKGIRRARMDADNLEADYRETSEKCYSSLKDLETTVDVLKTDVVRRKVKLDPIQLEAMEKELATYTNQINNMNSTFETLQENLKAVMKEELEIIVNEEQFLEDEEPMLEDATIKCEELTKIMETLKKVAEMQKEQGTNAISIFTASEYDIMEDRHNVMAAISALVPNHNERIQSIQATKNFREAQKKFVKSESDFVAEEIQFKSQNLRKTNAFEELERKRDEALKAMYTAQPPPHKFGRKTSHEPQFSYTSRKASISKCKSMSSIVNDDDSRKFNYSDSDEPTSPSDQLQNGGQIKRSQSFTKEKEKLPSSEDEKTKKKTVFGFFSKKSKSSKHDQHQDKQREVDTNGDVYVVDTRDGSNPSSPAVIPRSVSDSHGSRKSNQKHKSKSDRAVSVNFVEDKPSSRNKKNKNNR